MTEFQERRWGNIKNAFSGFSLEDSYTLRKAIVLKNVDVYWNLGLIHIANLELLHKEFMYDKILEKIYFTMRDRVNDRCVMRFENGEDLDMNDYEYMFRDQPLVYNEEVSESHPHSILYDVKNCFYKRKLVSKYSEMYEVIQDMVNV